MINNIKLQYTITFESFCFVNEASFLLLLSSALPTSSCKSNYWASPQNNRNDRRSVTLLPNIAPTEGLPPHNGLIKELPTSLLSFYIDSWFISTIRRGFLPYCYKSHFSLIFLQKLAGRILVQNSLLQRALLSTYETPETQKNSFSSQQWATKHKPPFSAHRALLTLKILGSKPAFINNNSIRKENVDDLVKLKY